MSAATQEASRTRPVLRGLALLFYAASALVLVAAWQLFVLTGHTDRFFAWTIAMPLTAAVDGAFYLAGFFLLFPSARARTWGQVRSVAWGVLAVSTLKLAATLLHLDLFHFSSGEATARIAAWGWLVVYLVVPVALGALIVAELRSEGTDPPAASLMSRPLRGVGGLLGVILLLVGAGLFAIPDTFVAHWPWPLTPLTSQALSAWFAGVGIVAILVVRDGDRDRARHVWVAAVVLSVFQGIALLRYGTAVDWSSVAAWAYVALFTLVGIAGAWGWASSRAAPEG
jgi:hypothetical protein